MTQYIRKYTLTFATPWEGEQDLVNNPSLAELANQSQVIYPTTFVSMPQYLAELKSGIGKTSRQQLEDWKRLKRENLRSRWEAFSQGGGEWGRDFENGVGKIFTITNLHVEFDIESASNDMEDGGECEITIYNLSQSFVDYLEQASNQKIFIKLEAGYVDDVYGVIYEGVVSGMEDTFEDQDRVTTITCQKGGFLNNLSLAKYYPKDTPLENVIVDLSESMGMAINFPERYESLYVLSSPLYVYGNPKDALKQVLDAYDLIAMIQGAYIEITTSYPENPQYTFFEPYVVGPSTGLIGIPTKIKDENATGESTATQGSSLESNTGIEFITLLNPNLRPQEYIIMDSRYFKGIYRLTEVKYVGSYEGSEWFCECKAELVPDFTQSVLQDRAAAAAEQGG